MRTCLIFNPTAGRRRARRRLERFLETWGDRVALRPTDRPGHAAELAQRAAGEGFDVVAAAGGDGTVHEVAGGLLRAGGADGAAADGPALAVVPVGSANDYAHSLARQFGTHTPDDEDAAAPVDVGVLRAGVPGGGGGERERFFVACAGAGLSGEVTLHSRGVRHLQGTLLYGLAAWRAVRRSGPPGVWRVGLDDAAERAVPTRSFAALLGRREGNFLMAPGASLDDGLFDAVRLGPMKLPCLARLVPRVALFGPPAFHKHLHRARCRRVRIAAPAPLTVHADGELFLTPADRATDLTIDLLPGRLRAVAWAA